MITPQIPFYERSPYVTFQHIGQYARVNFNHIVDRILRENNERLYDLELDVTIVLRSIERFQKFDYYRWRYSDYYRRPYSESICMTLFGFDL